MSTNFQEIFYKGIDYSLFEQNFQENGSAKSCSTIKSCIF